MPEKVNETRKDGCDCMDVLSILETLVLIVVSIELAAEFLHLHRMESYERKIDEHVKKMDEHMTKMDEHLNRMDYHISQLDEHIIKLKLLGKG